MFWKNAYYSVSIFIPIVILLYFIFIYKRLVWGKILRNLSTGTESRKQYFAEKVLIKFNTENMSDKDKIGKAKNKIKTNIRIFRLKSLLLLLVSVFLFYMFYFTKENMIYTSSEDISSFYTKYKNLLEIAEIESHTNTRYNAKEAKEILEKLKELKKNIKKDYKNFALEEKTTIIIDVGHGGIDPGTVREKYYEKNINLEIALNLKKKLEKKGINVVLTRDNDKTLHIFDRIEPSFYYKKIIFISIHINSWKNKDINGYDVFYYSGKKGKYYYEDSKKIGEIFYNNLKKQNFIKNRTVKEANFNILKYMNSIAPSILFEIGFITNENDFEVITNKEIQEKIVEQVQEALMECIIKLNL